MTLSSFSRLMDRFLLRFPGAVRFLPFLRWRARVTPENFKADAVAGLTGALVVLPQAVAFATIAGLPPEYGLYAAMIPTIIAALFGSSWHLVSGPTTAISIVVFASISPLADPGSSGYIGLVLTLTLMSGVFQLLMGLAKMGRLVNFISHTVVIGFTAGAALLIAGSQIKNFFGLDIPRGSSLFEVFHQLFVQFTDINPFVTGVAFFSLMTGLIARRHLKKIPYMIVSMVAGGVLAAGLNFIWGAEETGVRTVGALVAHLPPFSAPDLSFEALRSVFFPALAVTVLGLTEAVSISRSVAVKSGQYINGNQEFIGQGLSNIFGAFFSGYASSGSFNRSGVNYEAGAKTPLAAVFSAFLLFAILLLVAPFAAYLPIPAMAAVLFMVAWNLVDFHHFGAILRGNREEAVVLLVSFIGTVIDLEKGIFVGILVSLIFYLARASRPAVRSFVPDLLAPDNPYRKFVPYTGVEPECPQLKALRIEGDVFFGAVDHIRQSMTHVDEKIPTQKSLLLLAEGISSLDLAGAEMLAREATRRRKLGGGLYISGVREDLARAIHKSGYEKEIDFENLFVHKSDALAHIYPKLDPEICRKCPVRAFRECHAALPNGENR